MKAIFAITATGLLLSGLLAADKVASYRSPAFLPTNKNHVAVSVPKIWADKVMLYKGDSFQLYFDHPHSEYLGVIDPDGHFFYVVYPAECGSEKLQPFVPSEYFSLLGTLAINTSSFQADPYTYGVLENQYVFTQSGSYRFLLGDNLHTDDELFIAVLTINYRHIARPPSVRP